MASKLWSTATSNAFTTTLNGSIGSSDTSINLNSVSTLQAPGVIVVDRTDGAGNATPTAREYISFTGISSNTLTGCTRGKGGSTAQNHNTGAIAEECWSIDHWNDAVSFMSAEHDAVGHHVIGTATINYTETKNLVVTSIASIANMYLSAATVANLYISTLLNASGASLQAFPIRPVFVIKGATTGATTSVGSPLPMPGNAGFQFISAALRSPVSGSSLVLDFNKNFTSIIGDSNVLSILGGGTFVSTSSITTPGFVAGDIISLDIDNGGGSDLSVLAQAR